MQFKKYFFVVFLIIFFQPPSFARNSEELVFYELILNSYESSDMEKFYTLLDKFKKTYPNSAYKRSLIKLAVKSSYENKQYEKALFFMEQLDKREQLKLKSYRAECYLNLKNYSKVISLYGNSIPEDPISKQIIVNAYVEIADDNTISSENRAQATAKAIEILESQSLDSLPEDKLLTLSKLHFKSNQYKKSAKILQYLLKNNLSNKEELLIKLSLVQKNYNYKDSIKTLDKALKLNGRLKDVIAFHKMRILFENKQYKNLISSREHLKANLTQEKLPLLHYILGIAFLSNNEYSEAEKELYCYLKNNTDYENLKLSALENIKVISDKKKESLSNDSLFALAGLYLESNQYKKSARVLKEILKNEPSNKEDVLIQLSLAQKEFNTNLAIRTLNEVIKLNGTNKKIAAFQKMEILFENMQYSSLVSNRDFFQKNLRAEHLPLFHYFFGVAFLKTEKYYEAEREFNNYLKDVKNYSKFKVAAKENLKEISEIKAKFKLNYKSVKAYKNMLALFKNKQYNKLISSKKVFQKTLNPEKAPLLHYFLGVACLKTEKYSEAERELNTYLADIRSYTKLKEPALENLKLALDRKAQEEITQIELASYKKMMALFNRKKYNNLISSKDELQKSLNPKHLPLLHYFLGVAFLKNNEYTESEKAFNIYLSDTQSYKDLKLSALNYLKKIAQKRNDVTLLNNVETSIAILSNEESINLLKKDPFNDSNIDFSTISSLKKEKKFNEARKALKTFLKSANTQEKSAIHFELAHVKYLDAKYEKAKNSFKTFIKTYPNSTLTPLAWNYYIEASMNLAKDSSNEHAKAQLMHDVKICLEKNGHLSKLERIELMFLLARTQYELQSFEEAIETINILVKNKNIQTNVLAKCYLVLGYSYKNGHGDNEAFVFYIKKAKKTDPKLLENEKFQALLESFSKGESSFQASVD